MKEREGHSSRIEFEQIIRRVYGDIFSPLSDTDSDSISSGYEEVLMEMNGSYVNLEVLSYTYSTTDACYIAKIRSNMDISSTKNGDVMLEPSGDGERVCIFWPKGV